MSSLLTGRGIWENKIKRRGGGCEEGGWEEDYAGVGQGEREERR